MRAFTFSAAVSVLVAVLVVESGCLRSASAQTDLTSIRGGLESKNCDNPVGTCTMAAKVHYATTNCNLDYLTCSSCPASNPCLQTTAVCDRDRQLYECGTAAETACSNKHVDGINCGLAAKGGTCSISSTPSGPNDCPGGSPKNRCYGFQPCNGPDQSVNCLSTWYSCQ